MRSFHVFLADGTDHDFKAANYRVGNAGELIMVAEGPDDSKDPASRIYAPGTWTLAEKELSDDR